MPRVIVHLPEEEYEALLQIARVELRDPRDQVALWARQQLERAGYLPIDGRAPAGLALPERAGELARC